jgi:hypothetical protein
VAPKATQQGRTVAALASAAWPPQTQAKGYLSAAPAASSHRADRTLPEIMTETAR